MRLVQSNGAGPFRNEVWECRVAQNEDNPTQVQVFSKSAFELGENPVVTSKP